MQSFQAFIALGVWITVGGQFTIAALPRPVMHTIVPTGIARAPEVCASAAEIIAGLTAPAAYIAPKFLYDPLGSRLFEAICELPEYYPTRTEAEIVKRFASEIALACGSANTVIDLGAGNCTKAISLFSLLRPAQYVAVAIASEFVHAALAQLQPRFPWIDMHAVGQDFSAGLALPPQVRQEKRLFFYPGSSIGNFTPDEARAFLQRLRAQCDKRGGLLLGVDLVKDRATLEAAYDDALGVTAAFNRNVLRHANRIAATGFDLADWRHRAFFDSARSRVELHLEATRDVSVRWPGGERRFAQGQTIHTENSHKYSRRTLTRLLAQGGWHAVSIWTDPRDWYALVYAQPARMHAGPHA